VEFYKEGINYLIVLKADKKT